MESKTLRFIPCKVKQVNEDRTRENTEERTTNSLRTEEPGENHKFSNEKK